MSEILDRNLHLPDLQIVNFKGIDNLSISNLGRVNLLVGRNGIGKTTILEAIHVYANRGHYETLIELLRTREEFIRSQNEERNPVSIPDFGSLFFGRNIESTRSLSVGSTSDEDTLQIQIIDMPSTQTQIFPEISSDDAFLGLLVTYRGVRSVFPWISGSLDDSISTYKRVSASSLKSKLGFSRSEISDSIPVTSLGPELPSNEMLSSSWDQIALTEDERFVLNVLEFTGEQIIGVAVISDENGRRRNRNKIVVKLQDHQKRVPLKSLGDGITRLFAVSLALIECKNGFLTIDEVENGVHYSVQQNFWEMILQISQKHNIQVFATTHSFDCVKAFARAAERNKEADGKLIRLTRKNGVLRSVEYSQEELIIASDMDIEVR